MFRFPTMWAALPFLMPRRLPWVIRSRPLAPRASQAYSKVVTNTTCGDFPDTVTATGQNLCGGAQVTATASAICHVICPPCVGITKEVACYLGGNNCDTFRKFAIGVQGTHSDGTVQNPA